MKSDIVNPQEGLSVEDMQSLVSFFELLIEADQKEQLCINQKGKCDEQS